MGQLLYEPSNSRVRLRPAYLLVFVFVFGIFFFVGLPALWVWSTYYLVNGVRMKTLLQSVAVVIGFLLFNITYLTALSNFLSSENKRYGVQVDAFFVILLGIALEQLRQKFSRPAKEPM